MSNVVYGIIVLVLVAGAMAGALQPPAKGEVASGLMPEVHVTAPGPNRVVDEVVVRPFVAASLPGTFPAVN